MSRKLRFVTMTDALNITAAVEHLRQARNLLKSAAASKTLIKTRLALASAEGALRHAVSAAYRADPAPRRFG